MNMMTKIYASTAMSPVAMEAQDPAEHTITLPLVTPDVSLGLAALIEAYVKAVNSYDSRGDDVSDEDFDDGGLVEQIIAWPSKNYADLAAKTALSMYELRGQARFAAEAVHLPREFRAAKGAEDLMIAVSRDARTLAKGCNADREINARFLADYSAWAHELQDLAAPGTDEEMEARSGDAADAVAHRIFDRPAMNIAELALKMRVLAGYYFPGSDENPTEPHFENTGSVIEPRHFAVVYQDVQNLAKWEKGDAPIPGDSHRSAEEPKALPPILEWERALASYHALKDASDAMPLGTEGEDEAVDACCEAMDHLIEETPAPTIGAVLTKLRLALERSEGFEGLIEDHQSAIFADLGRLSGQYDPLLTQSPTPDGARQQPAASKAPSSVEVIHARWNAANAAYEVCDAVGSNNTLAQRGSSHAGQEARSLQLALLYQRPSTWRDAMILMGHVLLAVDANFSSEQDEMAAHERSAIQLAIESLVLFIIDNAETGDPLVGWLGGDIERVRERMDFRSSAHREAA